jgi:2'-hydroxyisoflavone reductase
MNVLVLGGTAFLGRHVVEVALERGHEVTIFHRGQTNPGLYAEVEELLGDREGGLEPLAGRGFDSVIDTGGMTPRVVGASARFLVDAGHYAFVSTGNVYADFAHGPLHEDDPVATMGGLNENDRQAYGPLKAECERIVLDVFGRRALVARSGLLAGAYDPTGRFTYWPHRIARGGRVLAPAPPGRLVQFIDARDTATWLIVSAERRVSGVFNVVGPRVAFDQVLAACRAVTGSDAEIVWVEREFLIAYEVGEWIELPLWIADLLWKDFMNKDISRALAAGLTCRPLEETVRDTLERAQPAKGAGLTPEREADLLAAWRLQERESSGGGAQAGISD